MVLEVTPARREHLQLVGLHVEADFVTSVQMDIPLHIIRGVGEVEHLLWTVTHNHQT